MVHSFPRYHNECTPHLYEAYRPHEVYKPTMVVEHHFHILNEGNVGIFLSSIALLFLSLLFYWEEY